MLQSVHYYKISVNLVLDFSVFFNIISQEAMAAAIHRRRYWGVGGCPILACPVCNDGGDGSLWGRREYVTEYEIDFPVNYI